MKILAIAVLFVLLSHHSANAEAAKAAGPRFGGLSMGFGPVAELDLSVGVGNASNVDKSIPQVSTVYAESVANVGFRLGPIAPVFQAAYRSIGQVTDPATVNNVNMGGAGYVAGVGLKLYIQDVSASLVYDFTGNYKLKATTLSGSEVSYGGVSGAHLIMGYHVMPALDVVVIGSFVTYKTKTVDGADVDISSNLVNQALYGVGIGFHY